MDRDSFFSRKISTTSVDLDDGTTLSVRKLSQAEVREIQKRYSAEDKTVDGLAFVMCRCTVDRTGERMFADDDLDRIAELPFDDVSRVANAVMRFSGMIGDDAGEAGKGASSPSNATKRGRKS